MQNKFITVPETTLPNGTVVPSFQVGQYACSKGEDGKAIVTLEGKPWVRINYHEARQACTDSGFDLITETQWLAIARDVSQQACNWTGGKKGSGYLFQGLRNRTVSEAQPGNYIPPNSSEHRWLTLSNGEHICDLSGNIYQWVFDNVQGDAIGIIARNFANESPSITTAPYPSEESGMGHYDVWDWSGDALVRGASYQCGPAAGAFLLDFMSPIHCGPRVGFRCTRS